MLYFYERSVHAQNKQKDIISRYFMLKTNRAMGVRNLRRVSPKVKANFILKGQVVDMQPMLSFAARLDAQLSNKLISIE